MSKVKIQGNASGTGVLTVTAPNTSTDRTITLPDGTGTLLTTDGDGSSLTGVGVDGISSSANATAITIDSNENVGIGTSAPSAPLHVNGGGGVIRFGTHTTALSEISHDTYSDAYTVYNNKDSAGHSFKVNGTEKFRIVSSGNVGIGETSPSAQLHLNQATGDQFLKMEGATATHGFRNQADGSFGLFDFTNSRWLDLRSYSSNDYQIYTNGSSRLQITSDGRGLSQFTAKAWVNVNCPSAAIRDSHNISSIVDQDTGRFDVNIDTNMANANYVISSGGDHSETENYVKVATWVIDAGKFNIHCHVLNGSKIDLNQALAIVFGD